MSHVRLRLLASLAAVAVALPIGASVAATPNASGPPDAEAMRFFEKLVKSYRARPAHRVKSTLKIDLVEDDITSSSREVAAEFTWSRPAAPGAEPGAAPGVVRIRDMTCRFHDGVFSAVHDDNAEAFYRETYEGSPYWLLLINFQDIPYPHLGLVWGEAAPEEICMQLVPETPGIVPSKIEEFLVEGVVKRGLVLSSPNGELRLVIDPKTMLIDSMEHEVTGGPTVQPGIVKRTTYRLEHAKLENPLPATEFELDPGDRQSVDMLSALMPPPEAAPAPGPGPGVAQLVGQPAPPLVLATAEGGAVDLEDLRGKVVVLDFWATWCGPCRRALPILHEVARWARDEDLPVEILTVNVWESRDPNKDTPDARLTSVRAFWEQHGFTLPIAMDYTDEVAAAYGVRGIPATFVIRSDGVVHGQPHADAAILKQSIQDALAALEAP